MKEEFMALSNRFTGSLFSREAWRLLEYSVDALEQERKREMNKKPTRLYTSDFTQMELLRSIISARQYEDILDGLRGENRKYYEKALLEVYYSIVDTPEVGVRSYPGLNANCALRYMRENDFYYVIDFDLGNRDGSQNPATVFYVDGHSCGFRPIYLKQLVGWVDAPRLDLDFRCESLAVVREQHESARLASDDFLNSWGHCE